MPRRILADVATAPDSNHFLPAVPVRDGRGPGNAILDGAKGRRLP